MRLRYIILVILFLPQLVFATNKVHIVSVGISDYPGTGNDLTLPIKDADAMMKLYKRYRPNI